MKDSLASSDEEREEEEEESTKGTNVAVPVTVPEGCDDSAEVNVRVKRQWLSRQ